MDKDATPLFLKKQGHSILKYRLRRLWRRRYIRRIVQYVFPIFFVMAISLLIFNKMDVASRLSNWFSEANNRIASRSEFTLKTIEVRGRNRTSIRDIRQAVLGTKTQISSFDFDAALVKKKVEAISWVRTAQVSMVHPDIILITLEEYTPVAIWYDQTQLWLLDPGGVKIKRVQKRANWPNLPLILGAGAPEALNGFLSNMSKAPSLLKSIKGAVRIGQRRWTLVLDNGISVRMPEYYFGQALNTLLYYQSKNNILNRDIEQIDLRNPTEITIRLPKETL